MFEEYFRSAQFFMIHIKSNFGNTIPYSKHRSSLRQRNLRSIVLFIIIIVTKL